MDGGTFSDFVYKPLLGEAAKDMYVKVCLQRGGHSDMGTLIPVVFLGPGQPVALQ